MPGRMSQLLSGLRSVSDYTTERKTNLAALKSTEQRELMNAQSIEQNALSLEQMRKKVSDSQKLGQIMAQGGDPETIYRTVLSQVGPDAAMQYKQFVTSEAAAKQKADSDALNQQSLIDERTSQNEKRTFDTQKATFDVAQGSVAPEVTLPGEVYPPQQQGAEMYEAPSVQGPLSLKPVQVGQQQIQPQSAQDIQRVAGQTADAAAVRTRETERLQQQVIGENRAPPVQIPGRDIPFPPAVQAQRDAAAQRSAAASAGSILNQQRAMNLENQSIASPGQLVYKSSGNPVPGTQLPDPVVARLEGLQTAIGQADVVEKALLALGDSGAIKGYIEENGVYWPVVQDRLTEEQAAAVSETNRMLSAYAQAVSGLAVSEQEIGRLKRSAPSVRMTPGANRTILGHFRRNANVKLNNYLTLKGWKINDAAPDGGAAGPSGSPDAFTLPDGTTVKRQPDGTYR